MRFLLLAVLILSLMTTTVDADIGDPNFDTNTILFEGGDLNNAGSWVGRSGSYAVSGGILTQTGSGGSGTRFGQVFLADDVTGTGWSLEIDLTGINTAGANPLVQLYGGELLETPNTGVELLRVSNNQRDDVEDGGNLDEVLVGAAFDYFIGNGGADSAPVSGVIDASEITVPQTVSFDITTVDLSPYDVMAVKIISNGSQSNFLSIDRVELVGGGGGPTPLQGDFNGDGTVDAADYTLYVDNLGQTDESAFAPGTGDGLNGVDPADYTLWRNNFGNTTPPLLGGGGGAVPEPGTIALLIGGLGLGVVTLRNRRK